MTVNDASKPFAGRAPESCVKARAEFKRDMEPRLSRPFGNFSEYVERENITMPFSTLGEFQRKHNR